MNRLPRAFSSDVKSIVLLFGSLGGTLALGQNENEVRPHYRAEVWYNFRERAEDGEISAPDHQAEVLPVPACMTGKGVNTCTIHGRVAHLPYIFDLRVTEKNDNKAFDLKVIGENGKEAAGFPKHLVKAHANAADGISVELPTGEVTKGKIKDALLSSESVLTYVSLVIREEDGNDPR